MKIDSGKIGEHFVSIKLLEAGLLVDMASENYPYDLIVCDPNNINGSVKIDVKTKMSGGWVVPKNPKSGVVYVFVNWASKEIEGWMTYDEFVYQKKQGNIKGINLAEKFFTKNSQYSWDDNNILRALSLGEEYQKDIDSLEVDDDSPLPEMGKEYESFIKKEVQKRLNQIDDQ